MRFRRPTAALAFLMCLAPSVGRGQTSATDDQMRRDIETLKEGQKSIQKDLEEIKRLLQGLRVERRPMPFPGSRSASRRSPPKATATPGSR